MNQRYAFFGTTSDSFFAGSCVAISSFIKHNKWFKGDIIIVTNDLSPDRRSCLQNNFNNIRILDVDPRILKKAKLLKDNFPKLGERTKIFYNMQAFSLSGYDRLLKFDADMLFRGDVRALFELKSDIAGCPSIPMYFDKSRSVKDFSLVDKDDKDAFPYWMNAGLYSVSGDNLNDNTFEQLMEYMGVDFWGAQQSNHTDQLGVNLHFNGKIEELSATYNYLLTSHKQIRQRTGISIADALVWHYVDKAKPWLLNSAPTNPSLSGPEIKAMKEWLDCYMFFMQQQLLRGHTIKNSKPI